MDDKTIDKLVGEAIRARRKALNQSQTELAAALGVSFQQLQKYESAINRVSASKLWLIAKAQRMPVSAYFRGVQEASYGQG